jgi:hypothetical protein
MNAETHGVLQAKCPLFFPILTKLKGSTNFSKPDWYKKSRFSSYQCGQIWDANTPVLAQFEVLTAVVMNSCISSCAITPCNPLNNAAYRPVAKRWLCKQRPFLGNGSVNRFPLLGSTFFIIQQLSYNNGNGVFLRGPCRGVILKTIGATQSVLYGSLWRQDFSRR